MIRRIWGDCRIPSTSSPPKKLKKLKKKKEASSREVSSGR